LKLVQTIVIPKKISFFFRLLDLIDGVLIEREKSIYAGVFGN